MKTTRDSQTTTIPRQVYVKISQAAWDRLSEHLSKSGQTKSFFVSQAIVEKLDREGSGNVIPLERD
jgi:hypothetical protein